MKIDDDLAGNDTIVAGDDYVYDMAVIDRILEIAECDRPYINIAALSTPVTINYAIPPNGTTSGSASIEEVEPIDFRGGTGNDHLNTSAATYSIFYGGAGNDTLTTGAGDDYLEGGGGIDV